MAEATPGGAAYSLAGRDKGELMIILRVEAGYAYLADGKKRRVENPKKKKLRHLNVTNFVSDAVLKAADSVENHTVRKALTEFKAK